jgi:hypothetical protein
LIFEIKNEKKNTMNCDRINRISNKRCRYERCLNFTNYCACGDINCITKFCIEDSRSCYTCNLFFNEECLIKCKECNYLAETTHLGRFNCKFCEKNIKKCTDCSFYFCINDEGRKTGTLNIKNNFGDRMIKETIERMKKEKRNHLLYMRCLSCKKIRTQKEFFTSLRIIVRILTNINKDVVNIIIGYIGENMYD